MLQSLIISKSETIFENGRSVDTFLECKMENGDKIFTEHPKRIFLNGAWYQKTGWDSDKRVVYYRRVK